MLKRILISSLFSILLPTRPAFTQDKPDPAAQAKPAATDAKPTAPSEEAQAEALQKAVQNPVASLISVPLQNNMNLSYGPFNRTQDVLNIQPVIPARVSENWNLITRIIQPLVWQPYPNQNTGGEYGLGDMNPTFFLSAAKPGKLIWGVGPTMMIPTATSDITGQGQFSLGPSLVVLAQPPHWTIGALINNVWSVAGESGRAGQSDAAAVLPELQHERRVGTCKWRLLSPPIGEQAAATSGRCRSAAVSEES